MKAGFAFSVFVDRLMSIADLSVEDIQALASMPSTIRHYDAHDYIYRHGDHTSQCCLLLQGYLCWTDNGRHEQQITSIHVPGDIPDLHTIHHAKLDFNLVALGPVVVAFVPHAFFQELAAKSSGIARTLSLLMIADAASLRNWIVNLGRRDAATRVAHLLCEIAWRLRFVGQARSASFASPFTQSDLAAACGISAVHANRIIQAMRRKGLLQWHSRTITITDWEALVKISGFRPNYLDMKGAVTAKPMVRAHGVVASADADMRPELPT